MMQRVALLVFVALIVSLLVRDVRHRRGVSAASWLVLIWVIIFASRPLSTWLQSGGGVSTPDAYLEGNPLERSIFTVLIFLAGLVLIWRRVPIGTVIQKNVWLFAFFGYCLVSVMWSDYPFVAFKRWFKDFGNVVMVLVLLTEKDPGSAIKAVFARCAYVLVPLSVLFIRYYPELGRAYAGYSQNDLMYIGVATHKNTLGALLLTTGIFLFWSLVVERRSEPNTKRLGWLDSSIVLLMTVWLLLIADSATALLCTVLGAAILLATSVRLAQRQMRFLGTYAVAAGLLWLLLDSAFNMSEVVVLSLGRDMTLTTRTGAWELLVGLQTSPWLGAGFKSFWAGDRMIRVWEDLPGIVQAHSGYVETYLNGGFLGLGFVAAMMLGGFVKIKRQLVVGSDLSRLRFTFWVVALVYNYSEAAFNQLSLLWFVTVLVLMEGPIAIQDSAAVTAPDPSAKPVPSLHQARWHSQADSRRQTGQASGRSLQGRWVKLSPRNKSLPGVKCGGQQ